MKGNTKWGLAGLALGLAAALTLPSLAQTSPEPGSMERTVTVNGTATIRSTPDEAVVTLGVQTQGETAEEAMSANAQAMDRVLAALQNEGIGSNDLATAWINLYPTYGETGMTIVGYSAENQVQVTIHDVGRIGRVIDQAVEAGANLTSGITFGMSDENAGVDDALGDAVADARHKAEILADASGAELGVVLHVSEAGTSSPPSVYYSRAEAVDVAATPIETPTLETQVSVTVTWELL